jgi:hypothetical protein
MPDAADLYRAVRAAIAEKAGCEVLRVQCEDALDDHLTAIQKEGLAPRLQAIAREFVPGAVISLADAADLDDVLSAYNLVGTRAGLATVSCNEVPLHAE